MDVRHGFRPVPRWRVKAPLGAAITAALITGLIAGAPQALAVPAEQGADQPTTEPAGDQLEAPDIASARTIAALERKRVEVIGERTETSSTWVNPDGTMTTGQAQAPIWVRQGDGDGTASPDWAAVDLTLERDETGGIRPKAHSAGLVLAGAGVPEDGQLVALTGPDGQQAGIDWAGELPEPELAGPRATYADVQPGVDLVVEATRTGYEQFFVLTERPAPDTTPDLQLTVSGDGLTAATVEDGGVQFTDAAGEVVGGSTTPQVWDAGVDAERVHPITEPWVADGEPSGVGLAPLPDWGTGPAGGNVPTSGGAPTATEVAPLPPGSESDQASDPGQVTSPEAAEAGGSVPLPLPEAAEVTAPDAVQLDLTPDASYLADPETEYPVVVDPDMSFAWGFDTWVQTGFNSDQSGSTELKVGTYDGGATVARSFITWDLSSLRGTKIYNAELMLWNFHSYSCASRPWEVWNTELAGTGTRINNQPIWWQRWATSYDTVGHDPQCGDGWAYADLTSLVQTWANNGNTLVSTGIKAADERDTYAWKRFNSAQVGAYVPTLYVQWSRPPEQPTNLAVSNSPNGGGWTSTTTPRLSAVAHDPDGDNVYMNFKLHRHNAEKVMEKGAWVQNGQVAFVDVDPGVLTEGATYTYVVETWDGNQNGPPSPWMTPFTVDTAMPATPRISSTDYPNDGTWHKGENQAGTFAVSLPAGDSTLAGYEWGLDQAPMTLAAAGGATTLNITPTTNGIHALQVQALDRAGNRSPVARYVFNVGRAGLVSPVEGAQVVRRVRLDVSGESVFTHVKYQWRRGPDATNVQDIALGALSSSNGAPLTSAYTALQALGEHATWDAGLTLGHVAGPVQVRAVVATSSAGAEAYNTPWVTVTVSPDALGAATDDVGPGSVNLLTGDYSLSSTDVDEFGLALGRTTSSRDPRAGMEPQSELLTATQQTVADANGWVGGSASVARDTSRFHAGNDSLVVTSNGSSADSWAAPIGGPLLRPGSSYRVTGWIYVPAGTGLNPEEGNRGVRLHTAYQAADGQWKVTTSPKPTLVDAWQQLSVDVTIPADARTNTEVRLYNGFAAAGKQVFFDDLSVREIWSPLGPQWNLGASDEVAATSYSHVTQPSPDVAVVHLSGGGEIWFTGSGDGKWWPQPGAEDLTLTGSGRKQWRLTELDGTVSFFSPGASGLLQPGQKLLPGQSALSTSGQFHLDMQTDGNLVLYRGPGTQGNHTWATNTFTPGTYAVMQPDGNLVAYAPNGTPVWDARTWGNPESYMIVQNDGNLVVYRPDARPIWDSKTFGSYNPEDDIARLLTTSPPATAGKSRLLYENVGGRLRLSRMIGAVEPGVDGFPDNRFACTGTVPAVGCEVVQLVYNTGGTPATTTATAFGNHSDRLAEVRLHSTAPGASVTDAVTAVKYAYDDQGRLREVWDPRIPQPLKTKYDYDVDGRVLVMQVPGELPWRFSYGSGGAPVVAGSGDLIDRSSGRLLTVSRASLKSGTLAEPGPDTTSTVVYNVPLDRAAGGPYDLNPAALATWAQTRGPTDATAVFGPEDPPAVTTATATAPGKDGYKAANVHYLDASAREVNTATPSGPGAPAAGFIDTAEYDRFGNVVRSLDASSRLLALGQLPSATTDLAALNLTQASTAARATALSTLTSYSRDGLDVERERGPLLRLAIGNDPNNVKLVHDLTTYTYDKGPDGFAYHLVTSEKDEVLIAGTSPEQVADTTITVNGYNPIDGADPLGPTSGWKTGQPTTVTVDAGTGGLNVTAKVRYDAQGRAIESQKAGSNGNDAGTTRTVFYSTVANAPYPECGNRADYAGLACKTLVAGPVTGANTAVMASALPVKTITAYNRYGSVAAVTETATGPVGGASVTQSRTTTTSYDAADRVTSVALTSTGPGMTAVGTTTNTYDAASGDVTAMETKDAAGKVTSRVTKTFDALGRMASYDDGAGNRTDSVFDQYSKPTKVTDSTGASTTFTYDRAKEPRGFVTSVTDSVAGTISATYGPDGQVLTQSLPGGVSLNIGYDANANPVTRTYVRDSDKAVLGTSSVIENGAGQWIRLTSTASVKTYAYDRVGRLTDVTDTTTGINRCTARSYAYNDRAERTKLTTAVSGTATCANPASPGTATVSSTGYTYDTGDRLVSDTLTGAGAWVYDPLGRITTAPVRGNPGKQVTNAFYANDLVSEQTIAGVDRQTWTLDALQRFSGYTNYDWAAGSTGVPAWQQAVSKVNHYDSDSDSPSWIAEDTSLPSEITRFVDGLDGDFAVQTGKTGARVLQLVDLHGDVMTTVPIRDGMATADWTGLRHKTNDEFGNTTDLTTGGTAASTGAAPGKNGRYGWLGGKQRSSDALANVLLMGVRLYDPTTGRFWSTDPVPGGNGTAYDYCTADPVNCTDLDGNWSWKSVKKGLGKVAKVAEYASYIPGPIGVAASGISAGAYAASGNKRKALEMGVSAGAAFLPGGRAMVKAGFAAAKSAGKVSAKAGKALAKKVKGCNSFTPDTGVLMADGTTVPINQVRVGDLVAARDPQTGELTAQPVLNVVVGHGDKHLIEVATAPAPAGALSAGQVADADAGIDSWTTTANHPIWVSGKGWTDAEDLSIGDLLTGATGKLRTVQALTDEGWRSGQTVYNLSVANAHTFIVGDAGDGTLVHNASVCQVHAPKAHRGPGVYSIHFTDGTSYVGRSLNVRARVNSHFTKGGKFYNGGNGRREIAAISTRKGSVDIQSLRRAEQARIDNLRNKGRGLRNARNEIRR